MTARSIRQTKYYRIKEDIKRRILRSELLPGDRVMSEAEICQSYGVSRISAKRALDELVLDGYVHRVSGSGSFVSMREALRSHSGCHGFSDELRRRGMRPSSRLVDFRLMLVADASQPQLLRDKLGLEAGDGVYHIQRLRYGDEQLIALEDSYIPAGFCPHLTQHALDLPTVSLYGILEHRYHCKPEQAEEICRACVLEPDQARLLETEAGDPALLVERISYVSGRAVEYSVRIFRGGSFEYRVDLA